MRYMVVDVATGHREIMEGSDHLSANFTVDEVRCNDGSSVVMYSSRVLAWVQEVRDHYGKPIIIGSGHRTPEYNDNMPDPGATHSRHIYGDALDLYPPKGVSVSDFFDVVEKYAGKINGIGRYVWGVHVDDRGYHKRW